MEGYTLSKRDQRVQLAMVPEPGEFIQVYIGCTTPFAVKVPYSLNFRGVNILRLNQILFKNKFSRIHFAQLSFQPHPASVMN